jgi:hypothetical protein
MAEDHHAGQRMPQAVCDLPAERVTQHELVLVKPHAAAAFPQLLRKRTRNRVLVLTGMGDEDIAARTGSERQTR